MKQILSITALTALLLSGCQTTQTSQPIETLKKESISDQQKHKLMIGKWYGNQPTKDGGRRQQLTERREDGTYVIHFRIHEKNGDVWDQIETGEWGIAGDIYFSIFKGWIQDGYFKPTDPTDTYNRDAYRVITLNQDEFIYEAVQNGERYTLSKVGPEFTL